MTSVSKNKGTKTAASGEDIRLFLSAVHVKQAMSPDGKKVKLQCNGEDFESDILYMDETFAIVSVHECIALNIQQALKSATHTTIIQPNLTLCPENIFTNPKRHAKLTKFKYFWHFGGR